jgi:hypothetical protein
LDVLALFLRQLHTHFDLVGAAKLPEREGSIERITHLLAHVRSRELQVAAFG